MSKIEVMCDTRSIAKKNLHINDKEVMSYVGYVPVTEILKFSNDSNVRAVNPKAPVIKKIEATLENFPENMAVRSNGVTVTAKGVMIGDNKIVLDMREIDGIINGGHNQKGISNSFGKGVPLDKAEVLLRVLVSSKFSNRDIASISTSLNDSCSPSEATLLEKKGLAENIKNSLKPEYCEKIEWKENTMIGVPHIKASEFYMLLNLLDIRTYGGYSGEKEKKVSKSVKSTITKMNNEVISYDYLSPVMNDIVKLYDEINVSLSRVVAAKGRNRVKDIEILCESRIRQAAACFGEGKLNESTTLFTNEPFMYPVNKGYLYVILSAFRANLVEDEDGVHWVSKDVVKLFKSIEKDIWKTLVQNSMNYVEMKDGRKIADASASTKPKSGVWSAVYNQVKMAVQNEELKKLRK